MAQNLTDSNFQQEVLEFDGVVLIDFWAEWCGPCKAIAPIIEEIAEKYKDNPKVKIGKVDVDENPQTQSKYRILSIPSLLIFKEGEVVHSLVGIRPQEELEAAIEASLE